MVIMQYMSEIAITKTIKQKEVIIEDLIAILWIQTQPKKIRQVSVAEKE